MYKNLTLLSYAFCAPAGYLALALLLSVCPPIFDFRPTGPSVQATNSGGHWTHLYYYFFSRNCTFQGALSGLLVSAGINFWVGIGSNVLVPPPKVLHVGTQMCDYFNNTCGQSDRSENFTATTSMFTTVMENTTTTMVPDSSVEDDTL